MRVAIYHKATGKVLREVEGQPRSVLATVAALPDHLASHALAPGETALGRFIIDGAIVDGPPCPVETLRKLRIEVNHRLAESDWTQVPDSPADTARWAAYRALLRAAKKTTDPLNEVLPLSPKEEDAQ